MRLRHKFSSDLLLLPCFTLLGFAAMGYHPGAEDDGIYLAAVKSHLNPVLYPRDSDFFRLQLQGTVFDDALASFARYTHISLPVSALLWQLASILLIVLACRSISMRLFAERHAQWAGVAMVSAMFTLPVSGTAIYLLDQHLHPRNIAAALILLAVSRVMARKHLQALTWLAASFLMHPIMAAMGLSFCCILAVTWSDRVHQWIEERRIARHRAPVSVAALLPQWIFDKPNPLWKKALDTRTYYYLYKWTWYEWLGAFGPIVLFGLLWRLARKHNQTRLARFALAVCIYAAGQQVFAMAMLAPASLIRLTPLQPMRYLQLVYFFLTLIGGCLLGKFLLKASAWRWGIFLLVINGSMFAAQRLSFSASPHIEWPGQQPQNQWLQAFAWIRVNTPSDAYFVLNPRYLAAEGEDYHSFRALAERSQLCDGIKDTAVVTQIPQLAARWDRELEAQKNWQSFQLADFQRLKRDFGVDWALVGSPFPAGLDCKWHNSSLTVCRIP
jgi:hypothetical protein